MGMLAILVMWPRNGKQTFAPYPLSSMWSLASIGPLISEEKKFGEFFLYASV